MAVVAPLLASQQPAGAVVNEDEPSAQLTFVDYGGSAATCTLVNDSRHDTSAHSASAYGVIYGPSDCHYPNTYLTITVTGKDEKGVSHTASGVGYSDNFSVVLDHAVSSVRTTVDVRFQDCNPNTSASCELAVSAAPK